MSRVLIDASAAYDQRAGVGRYSRNLIDRLLATGVGPDWTLLHVPQRRGTSLAGWNAPEGARIIEYPMSRRRVDQLGSRLGVPLPTRLLTGPQDLVYSPDFVAPPMRGVPRVVTIHDLAFLTHPHLTTPGNVAFLRAVVEREARRGARFATVSETTRDRVEDLLGVDSSRLRVIPNGVDPRFFEARPPQESARQRLGLPADFHLMAGTIEPRKNHATVLEALRRRPIGGLPLVIVGRIGWGVDHLVPEIEAQQASGSVVWLGDLDDRDLPSLYAGATAVLYPSWTEGFGLPVLEALAAGRPVVTGNDPVFAEIGGTYVTTVDPGDVDALAEAMGGLERARWPEHLVDERRAWAARYNWDNAAVALRRWIDEMTGGLGG